MNVRFQTYVNHGRVVHEPKIGKVQQYWMVFPWEVNAPISKLEFKHGMNTVTDEQSFGSTLIVTYNPDLELLRNVVSQKIVRRP